MKVFLINPGMVDDYVYNLATKLSSQEIDIFNFGSNSYTDKELNFININYYDLLFNVNEFKSKAIKKVSKVFLYIFLQFLILKKIRDEQPDIIHMQWSRMPIIDSIFAKYFRRKTTIIFTLHNTTLNHGDSSIILKLLNFGFKSFLRSVDTIILHTNYSKEKFINDFPEFADKVKVIPHGLLKFPKTENRTFTFPIKDEFIILFFGNIKKYKGLDLLIEALGRLNNEKLKLIVAGRAQINIDGYKQMAADLKIEESIIWNTSFIDEKDVSELFEISDVVILPHRHIDQSGVLMTAVNFSKPVIASNIGGFSEVIQDGKHGYLFNNGDSDHLAEKIKAILDEEKLPIIIKNVDELRKSWASWDSISSDTSQIYFDASLSHE